MKGRTNAWATKEADELQHRNRQLRKPSQNQVMWANSPVSPVPVVTTGALVLEATLSLPHGPLELLHLDPGAAGRVERAVNSQQDA